MEKQERLDVFDSRSHWIILSIIAVATTLIGSIRFGKKSSTDKHSRDAISFRFSHWCDIQYQKEPPPNEALHFVSKWILFYPSFLFPMEGFFVCIMNIEVAENLERCISYSPMKLAQKILNIAFPQPFLRSMKL